MASAASAARRIALLSGAHRISRSSIVTREVTGQHNLTISGYAAIRKVPIDWTATSPAFDAAGYRWRIKYDPNGNSWNDSMSLFLELADDDDGAGDGRQQQQETEPVQFGFSLLDQAGNPVPEHTRWFWEVGYFNGASRSKGFQRFISWTDLDESGCVKDDSFTVRCDITVVKKFAAEAESAAALAARVAVPPSNLHEDLGDLLWKKKQGMDVVIDVGGETFEAHGWLLAARSPVFEAELLAAPKEKASGGVVRRRVEIGGVEPKVFKALLHFMYTDELPSKIEEEGQEEQQGAVEVAMAQGLLAAAHRYKLERLKLICEEMLCQRIDLDTVAGSLAVAEQHSCDALKAACVEFLSLPGNLKAAMETQGYQKIKANCPVMIDLILKQLLV
ncbi:BTB/POZ and MATH domain-containing protein 2-like [Miscanthus floridulus]|uniref:BTB/POZ and MATH domain-containing protein 2-like n=1 Tax=Miscanthus floridulus TaxID=154761 RepID=UPI00345A899F